MSGHPWPLFDLRVRTPNLELRLPTDDDLLELMRLAKTGIVDDDQVVFFVPWHRLPSPAFERQFLQHWWRERGSWNPKAWTLGLSVHQDGHPIGIQALAARDFGVKRVINSGSWLGRDFQGRGLGTEARAAILALAFDGLGAVAAESGYLEGNARSSRVSAKLGYQTICDEHIVVEGKAVTEVRVRCTPDSWRRDLVPVTIEGLEPCLGLFGIGELAPDEWATF
jgi:RimJ/RimL family protein N-acetyltransferase